MNPTINRARVQIHRAIRSGKLLPQACGECAAERAEAFVHDFTQPFDVRWLCHRCILRARRGLALSDPARQRVLQRSLDLLREVARSQQECRALGLPTAPVSIPRKLWGLTTEEDHELFPDLPLTHGGSHAERNT